MLWLMTVVVAYWLQSVCFGMVVGDWVGGKTSDQRAAFVGYCWMGVMLGMMSVAYGVSR